ncbi:MAG: protein-L-isoaspartate(D-aspartate) O-methyltransferase [Vicingaceae bacterium]
MNDSYRHKGLRKALVKIIAEKGITDKAVLDALLKVPRHLFFDNAFVEFAYQDKAFPIGSGQTISQPFTVGFQSQLLEIKKGDKVLEIGTGSGYQTAILLELGAKVFSVERQRNLFLKAKKMLDQLGYRPKLFYGDGFKGLPSFGPFDKVIITAGAPGIPQDLISQLKLNGTMVIPIDKDTHQVMHRFTKKDETGSLSDEEFGKFQFVPMLKNRAAD